LPLPHPARHRLQKLCSVRDRVLSSYQSAIRHVAVSEHVNAKAMQRIREVRMVNNIEQIAAHFHRNVLTQVQRLGQ
jgi:hypothetical protein